MSAQPVVAARNLTKSYGGIKALSDVSMDIHHGQVHALVGENGAGKSTLIKILAGAVRPDSGAVEIGGRRVALHSPHDAAAHGLAFIHQDPSLIGTMSVAENMFLGTAAYARHGITSSRRLRTRYRQIAQALRLDADPAELAQRIPIAQQTLVAIGRAIVLDAAVIVLDEPTATFSDLEATSLFTIIGDLTSHGTSILYVSHRLDEVRRIADSVTVLKNGEHVTTLPATDITDRDHLVQLIVGAPTRRPDRRPASAPAPPPPVATPPILVADHVSDGRKVADASLSVQSGEIVGLTGLVGSGRTELAKILFGAQRKRSGIVRLDGIERRFTTPRQAINAGMALVPEDRRGEGAIMDMTLRENTTLAILRQFRFAAGIPLIRSRKENQFVKRSLDGLGVKYSSAQQNIRQLSGGNQQKVVMAKWTAAKARVIICDEPTQGVDVGAKAEIYAVIKELAAQGTGILLISSEISEVIEQADRVLVMHDGTIVANLVQPTEQDVLRHCYGSSTSAPTSAHGR